MKKYYLIILLVLQSLASGQAIRFGIISSPEIGDPESEQKLNSIIQNLNSQENLDFTIFSGNITSKGKNSELKRAKNLIAKLNRDKYVFPGEFDSRLSESAVTQFYELFGDDKFVIESDSTTFIGITTSSFKSIGGHLAPENSKWLKENLDSRDTNSTVFLFTFHNPKAEIDNWFEITNLLSRFNKSVIIYGSGIEYEFEKILNIPLISIPKLNYSKNQMLNLLEVRNDSLFIFDYGKATPKLLNKFSLIKNGKNEIIDPPASINYEADIIWNYDLHYSLLADIVTANGLIYACDKSGLITCIDSTGKLVWEYDSFGTIINKPIVADGIFAAATLQGDLLTLNSETGESIQTIGFDDVITTPLIVIEYTGTTNFMIPKLSDSNSAIVLGTASGKMYCYDLETLQQIWLFDKVKGMVAAQPIYIENKIIFPAFDNSLYCVDARQGWLNWKWNGLKNSHDFPVLCDPVANDDNVYLVSNNGNVFAIDLLLGKTVWENDRLNAFESIGISEIGHRLFIKSKDDKLHIISAKTSTWVKELNMKFGNDKTGSKPIEYKGNIIFGTKSGYVYLVDDKFNYKKLFFMGSSAIHTIKHFNNGTFAASNIDGKITLFKID